jgi:hypothetical protein
LEGFVIESEEVIAQAALELCSGQPKRLTGRVAYSQALLAEMGISPQALTGGPFP